MAGKKLQYEIGVDASDAVSEFKKVGKAAEQAGKAIEKGLDVKPDSGKVDKFISNLKKAGTEAKNVAKAVESIKKFAPTVDDSEIANLVLSLRKAGTEFDEIEGKAKELGDAMKEIDAPEINNLGTNLKSTRTDTDDLAQSARGANSAMANMVGNAAQDIGVLGGVAGSAGVAIGQMAEYAADAKFSGEGLSSVLKNMAAVAGPIAAISVGLAAVSSVMNDSRKVSEAWAKNVGAFRDALGEAGSEVGNVTEALRETEELLRPLPEGGMFSQILEGLPVVNDLLGGTDQALNKVIVGMSKAGITGEEWAASILATAEAANAANVELEGIEDFSEIPGGVPPILEAIDTAMKAGIITAEEAVEMTKAYIANAGQAQDATLSNAAANEVFTSSMGGMTRALAGFRDEQAETEDAWARILELQYNGQLRTAEGLALWNQLRGALPEDEFAAIFDEKYNDFLDEQAEKLDADAEAMKEAAAAALEMAEAMADLGDTIAEIDTDDIANLGGALESELNKVDDIFAGLKFDVDFQPALNEALDGLNSFGPDLQTLADEWANILEGKPIDIFGNVRADDAEFQDKMAALTNLVQEGAVNAFDQGGVAAANTFVQSTAAQIAASTGLSIAEVYRIMGLPPDGSIDTFIKPQIDAEAKADAIAILESLAGVDPNNPIPAYLRLAVQTGDIEPQIGEIASKILAGEALGIPAKLEGVAQADIDAALAFLAGYGVTVTLEADPESAEGTIADVADGDYEATIDAQAETAAAAKALLDEASRHRPAPLVAIATNTTNADNDLDAVAADRNSEIWVRLPNYNLVARDLERLAQDRHSNIYVHTVGGGGGGGGATPGGQAAPAMAPAAASLMAAPMALGEGDVATLAAPAPMSISPITMTPVASTPVTNNMSVTIQAGMIGNRNELNRLVSRALRQHVRLNGSRN